MLINLIGPPGAGKSTFASRFVLEHPEFKFCPIDEYRIRYENEDKAWQCLLEDVVNNKNVVLESCGLSYRLNDIFNSETVRRRSLFTVCFTVQSPRQLYERLVHRHKRKVPLPPYLKSTHAPNGAEITPEFQAAYYFFEHIDRSAAPIDHTVYTDLYESPDAYYQEIVNVVNTARVNSLEHQERRTERFLNNRSDKLAEI